MIASNFLSKTHPRVAGRKPRRIINLPHWSNFENLRTKVKSNPHSVIIITQWLESRTLLHPKEIASDWEGVKPPPSRNQRKGGKDTTRRLGCRPRRAGGTEPRATRFLIIPTFQNPAAAADEPICFSGLQHSPDSPYSYVRARGSSSLPRGRNAIGQQRADRHTSRSPDRRCTPCTTHTPGLARLDLTRSPCCLYACLRSPVYLPSCSDTWVRRVSYREQITPHERVNTP